MGAGAIGHAAALAALGLGLASIAAAPAALRASTRLQAAAAGAWALALGSLAWAFVGADYTLAYVAANSRRDAPAPLRAAGVWGGMEGSLLLWTALLALVGAAAAPRLARDLPRRAGAAALGLLGGFAAANGAVLLAWADPFTRLAAPPLDGGGLSPILEHPAMVYHPPVLYLGLVGLAPLFALCAAASLAGGLDGAWERLARRLAAGPLALVTVGLAAGAGWAYAELGWGGYWAWDPVENAALAPWLAAAAFLHASRTGAGRRTLTALGTAPFALVAAGAAVTRSGASSSVHAFADNPQAGWALTVCAGSIALLGLAAVLAVRPKPAPSPPPVGAQRARWAGAALFALAALVVAAGTIGPWAASLGGGRSRTVDGAFFAAFLGPAAVVGLALGAAPAWAHAGRPARLLVAGGGALGGLAAWRTGWPAGSAALAAAAGGGLAAAFAPLRRGGAARLGSAVGHAGFAVLAAAVAGSGGAVTAAGELAPYQQLPVAGYHVEHRGVTVDAGVAGERAGAAGPGESARATLHVHRGRRLTAVLRPALVTYPRAGRVLAETALASGPRDDVQAVLRRVDADDRVVIEVRVRPLAFWLWPGAGLVAVGFALAALGAAGGRRARRRLSGG